MSTALAMGVSNVPIIVWRCVEEVERRGLDIIGEYRATGIESVGAIRTVRYSVPQVCIDSAVRRLKRGYLGKLSRGTRAQ